MKAIRVRQFGDPSVLAVEDIDTLLPAAGQVRVRVAAAGVNPVEAYVRSGTYARLPQLPYTPGADGAGTVDAVGPNVTQFREGDRVYIAAVHGYCSGTYAEQAICDATDVHPLSANVSFAQGAALGVPYVTAWRAVFDHGRAEPGQTLFVHGASGGVGIAAVQFGRAFGLTVIGTAGSDKGRALVTEQGAHHVLDHKAEGYRQQVATLTDGTGPDLIVEMLANVNLGVDLEMLAKYGRVVIVGNRGALEFNPRLIMGKDANVSGFTLPNASPATLARAHASIGAGLAAGTLRPVIGEERPLAEARTAHEQLMTAGSAYGKIVLVP